MSKQIIPTIAFLIILAALGWYIDSYLHDNVIWTIQAALYIILFALALGLGGSSVLFLLRFYESFLKARAVRRREEREADVHAIVSDTHGVFVREMNPKATWRPLHLNPITYQNGKQGEITPVELEAWRTWHALRSQRAAANQVVIPGQAMALPPGPVDILTALDSVQRCLIVGASDSGKTTLLQHITARRLSNSKVVVIDPHAYPGKWPGCMVIGIGRNYQDIDRALTALVQLMTKRYGDIGRGAVVEGNHPKLTIVIDEWRTISYNIKGAADAIKTLLTESRKAAFSVFVGSHSERVKALGLEGEGDLRDGFTMVRLTVVGGIRQASIDKGEGRQPVSLPGQFSTGEFSPVQAPDNFTLEIEPDEEEAQILELKAQGKSNREISQTVWGPGKFGDFYNQKIEQVVLKYG